MQGPELQGWRLAGGAAEALGTIAAFVVGGLGWAAL